MRISRLVNLQLKEQAEAAIKDKVATMSVHEVLSDKQPIVEELTARLREVAEGEGGSDRGLGLRIVTVQIKEAVVSSKRVWENLQKPFRAERARVARLAELATEAVIDARERATEQERETATLEADAVLSALRGRTEAEACAPSALERRDDKCVIRRFLRELSRTEEPRIREIRVLREHRGQPGQNRCHVPRDELRT